MHYDIRNQGFEVFGLDSAFGGEKYGKVLQVDCLFYLSNSELRNLDFN